MFECNVRKCETLHLCSNSNTGTGLFLDPGKHNMLSSCFCWNVKAFAASRDESSAVERAKCIKSVCSNKNKALFGSKYGLPSNDFNRNVLGTQVRLEQRALSSASNSAVKKSLDELKKCTIRTIDFQKFKQGRDVRLRTFKTRAVYMLSNAKLRRRVQHKIRRQRYFDSVAEKMLREARNLSGKDKHISIVVGNPNFGTLQGWKGGGSPWRRLVNSICMIVRRRIAQKNEKWTIVQVDERWSTKQYVLRNISFTLDQS